MSRERLDSIKKFPMLGITDEVTGLAASFVASGIIHKKATTDTAHIAMVMSVR